MRIGTNHGSLSDRIMSYYGDSPRGMVSHLSVIVLQCTICVLKVFALEFVHITKQ